MGSSIGGWHEGAAPNNEGDNYNATVDAALHGVALGIYCVVGSACAWRLGVHVKWAQGSGGGAGGRRAALVGAGGRVSALVGAFKFDRRVQFHAFLTAFFVEAVLHDVLQIVGDSVSDEVTYWDIFAFCFGMYSHVLFFTSLFLVLVDMLELMYMYIIERQFVISKFLEWLFWVLVCLPYAFITGLSLYFIFNKSALSDGDPYFDSSIILVCSYFALCGIGYFATTIMLLCRLHSLEKRDMFFHIPRKPLLLLLLVLGICLTCIVLQTTMFLYRPISGKYMNDYLFEFMAYWFPQITSSCLLLIVARKPRGGYRNEESTNLLNGAPMQPLHTAL